MVFLPLIITPFASGTKEKKKDFKFYAIKLIQALFAITNLLEKDNIIDESKQACWSQLVF